MQPSAQPTLAQGTGTPYGDFNSPGVKAGLTNAYPNIPYDQLIAANNSYQAQYGTNITPDALMRAASESQGNYLWGPPVGGGSAPTGATVADPTAKIQGTNGVYQNGAYTPNANVLPGTPGSTPVAANDAVNAALRYNPISPNSGATTPTDFKSAMANTTNLINQTGGGAGSFAQLFGGANTGGTTTAGTSGATGSTAGGTASGSDALIKQMQDALSKQQNPFDLLQARESALGIPAAQQQVSGLRQAITNTTNLLNQIAPSVEGRTANSLVTEAQANRMIQNESAPIQSQLSTLGTQEGNAQSALTNLMSQATSEANMQSQGQQQNFQNTATVEGLQAQAEAAKQAQANFVQEQTQNERNFLLQQAQAIEQFQKNLALDTEKLNLSKADQAEATRQFNATLALDQQKFQADQSMQQQKLDDAAALNQAKVDQLQALAALQASKGNASTPSGGGGGGGTTTGTKSSSNTNAAPSVNNIIDAWKTAPSQYGDYNPQGTNYHRWQAAEADMIAKGYDPNQYKKQLAAAFGSAADKKQYGVTGY